MSTAVTSKGQVTIPKPIRDLLDLGPGSRVEFERQDDGRIILKKSGAEPMGRFSRYRGHAGQRMTTEELMALTRGE
ncbi:MAG: AbrB/MazE/SpoVT family DNA-binding domain-containing protein [Microvirga sp.]